MNLHLIFNRKISLLFAFTFIGILSFSAQNPFDIESRLLQQDNAENIANPAAPDALISTQNPFDINNEPNRQKTKSEPLQEAQQNVNDPKNELGRPLKITFLLASIMFFVFVRNINLNGFSQLIQSFMSNVKLIEFKNSINGLFNTQLGLFYLFFFVNMAYFLYLVFEKNMMAIPNVFGGTFLSIFIILFGIYFVKYLVLLIIEFGLSIRRSIQNHLFSVSVHNIILGFALFVINIFYAFTSVGNSAFLMWLGIGIIAIMYLLRQAKGLQYLSDLRHFSFFHFFIYLCTCEISPLLIAAKLITG